MLFSCENDLNVIKIITKETNLPDQSVENIEVIYSDSTVKKMKMNAPEINRYIKSKNPYSEFPKGIKVIFYDKQGKEESSITAKYARYNEKERMWEAKNNVVASNFKKKQTLNTEQLFWDQNKELIYSNQFSRVTTENEVMYGDKFEASQSFTWYRIIKTKGTINLKNE